MASALGLLKRTQNAANPPGVSTSITDNAKIIKFGILGPSSYEPLIVPAKSHPEVIICAVASPNQQRAESFAKTHSIAKAYFGLTANQDLINDPEVDAVHISLPNDHHYEWTMRALAAGKHVLLEKPASTNVEGTREMFALAERKGLFLLEAVHYRFHPAIQRVKAIIDSGELGKLENISVTMAVYSLIVTETNVKYNYRAGGGAMMDMGYIPLDCIRYLSGSDPISVLEASNTIIPWDHSPVDRSTTATLELPNSVKGTLQCDIAMTGFLGFIPRMPKFDLVVTCEEGEIEMFNYPLPTWYHSIKVTPKAASAGQRKTRVEKAYTFEEGTGKGEDWWTTYRYQLEAFVDKIKGREPQSWITPEDSTTNMKWIEEVYERTGFGRRPKSTFVLNT